MKLQINGENLELVYSFRSAIYFEQITGHNIDFSNLTGNDLITLFYTVVIASLQKAKKEVIDMVSFLDVVDENGGDKCFMEFAKWYADVIRVQFEILNSTENEDESEKKEIKCKKKTKKA